jgi:hypothetical protein
MTTLILIAPYVAFVLGVTFLARALRLHLPTTTAEERRHKMALFFVGLLVLPPLALAQQAVDLRAATEAGNAIIMYLCGTFAAVGIVAAGIAMMMGRQSIAKWAFVGAMVCGLAFAIVRTMWTSMGLEASNVGTF